MQTKTNDSDLFIEQGNLYYQHESGVVFTTKLRTLQASSEDDQPFAIAFTAGLPEAATDYSPDPEGPEGRIVFEWVEGCDEHLESIGRAVAAFQAAAATTARLSVVSTGT